MSSTSHSLFVACAPGLEKLLVDELRSLDLAATPTPGGAELTTDGPGMYRALLGCGLGLRVLLRVASFRAVRFNQLERALAEIAWKKLLSRGVAVQVKASTRKSRLYHSGAVAERVQQALQTAVGATLAEEAEGAAVLLQARMDRDECVISLDLCGSPMQQRGYRKATGKAPLREDIARALLQVAGYDGRMALVDPLCGSGTLLIEGALMARGLAPGMLRDFTLRRLPLHDEASERKAREFFVGRERSGDVGPIVGGDRDTGAARAALENARRAGVEESLRVGCQPLSATAFPPESEHGGLIVCNPPYGHRIGKASQLRDLYAALGKMRQAAPAGYRLALVTSNDSLAKAVGVPLVSVLMTDLGGLKVRLYVEPQES